ncbi:MAG: hypothetical protein DRN04_16855 [Thermoprotei archaeon]|nr:MAG: hypothetical protein DRN04_16855 [Thermoprotei archaeon]
MKAPTLDEFLKLVEANIGKVQVSPVLSKEKLLELTIQVLIVEKRIEEALAKAKTEKEKKQLKEKLLKAKKMRDNVLRLYVASLLRGKPKLPPTISEAKLWLI